MRAGEGEACAAGRSARRRFSPPSSRLSSFRRISTWLSAFLAGPFPTPRSNRLAGASSRARSAKARISSSFPAGGRRARRALRSGRKRRSSPISDDPRGIAFLDDSARFVGRDADLVVERDQIAAVEATLAKRLQSFRAAAVRCAPPRRTQRNRARRHPSAKLDAPLTGALLAPPPLMRGRAT